jgi:uncharacterized delta-60 repeat protein
MGNNERPIHKDRMMKPICQVPFRSDRRPGMAFFIGIAWAVVLSWTNLASASDAGMPPVILECSRDETAFMGQAVTLRVEVTGTSPFQYQWGYGRTSIPDATNSILRFSATDFADAGDEYWVTVQNDFGSGFCGGMQLTVLPVAPIPGFIDTSFHAIPGYGETVVVQSDETIVTGGRSGIVRMTPDGEVDPGFIREPVSGISSIAAQPDGKWVALAGFGHFAECHSRILRFNANGAGEASYSPDLTEGIPFAVTSCISALGIQSNNKVVLAARVLWAGRDDERWLDPVVRRFNVDGSADGSFTSGRVLCDGLQALAILPDDAILLASHAVFRRTPNGALDPSFEPVQLGPPAEACQVPGAVYCIAAQPDGRILIGGSFSTVGTHSISHVARLHPQGGVDLSFRPPQFSGAEQVIVRALAVQPDGRVLIGGNFDQLDGIPREGLARLNPNGELDSEFVAGTGLLNEDDDSVTSITVTDNGTRALVGGVLGSYWGRATGGLIRVHLTNAPADSDGDQLPDTWESRYFGSIQSSPAAPEVDADSDGMTNLEEFRAGTDPLRADSVLKTHVVSGRSGGWALRFQSLVNHVYFVETSSSLEAFQWQTVSGAFAGTGDYLEWPLSTADLQQFYRIRSEESVAGIR